MTCQYFGEFSRCIGLGNRKTLRANTDVFLKIEMEKKGYLVLNKAKLEFFAI